MKFFVVFAFVLLAVLQAADRTTIFVALGGTDGPSCGTSTSQCATLESALEKGNNNTISFSGNEFTWTGVFINRSRVGYNYTGQSRTASSLLIDSYRPLVTLERDSYGHFILEKVGVKFAINRTSSVIIIRSGSRLLAINDVVVSQATNESFSGVDFLLIQGGSSITISNSSFTKFASNTVLIYSKQPTDNTTFVVNNTDFSHLNLNNAIFYDSAWLGNFIRPRFVNVQFLNITDTNESLPTPFGDQHPGLIDLDLVYCQEKTFELSNCTLKDLNLGISFQAPIYFSAEWEIRWQVPVFNITQVTFQNNSAGMCGGIAVNQAMNKDYVRLRIDGCKFYNNQERFPGPGQVTDLWLGGRSHTQANITGSCSNSCAPRIDDETQYELLPNCTGTPPITTPTCITNYAHDTNYTVSTPTQGSGFDGVQNAVLNGSNLTINIQPGVYQSPTCFINGLTKGYAFIGREVPADVQMSSKTVLIIANFSQNQNTTNITLPVPPSMFILLNYPNLILRIEKIHFQYGDDRPDVLIVSMSQNGVVNITNVEFNQSQNIEGYLRVSVIMLFKGNVTLLNVSFDDLESQGTIINHNAFSFNKLNLTNVTFTNLELTSGQAHIFNDEESEFGGLAFHFTNVTVENITRERSAVTGVDNALFRFSGTSFSEDFTPEVEFFSCVFRNIFIPSDSMILFDVPKEPIFVNCTFTNCTARYAGAINAKADKTYVRLYGCQFFSNRGSVPQESFSDLNIGFNSINYEPYDIMGTCSRSCDPRTSMSVIWFLPNCTNATDKDGQGELDPSTCQAFMTVLFVKNDTDHPENDFLNDCLTAATSCATIFGALMKGHNNRINISAGQYELPLISIGDTQLGYFINGAGAHGDNATRTLVVVNATDHQILLRDYPGVFLFLQQFRLWINQSNAGPRYIIHIATTNQGGEGAVDLEDLVINHNTTVTGLNLISLMAGRVRMVNVLFHNMTIYGPVVMCQDHMKFTNNTLFCLNVTIGNVSMGTIVIVINETQNFTLGDITPLIDSGGFYHEYYMFLLLENFTNTYTPPVGPGGLGPFGIGLIVVSDDVSIFELNNCTFRNLNLGVAYQAPVVFASMTDQDIFGFAFNTFTNNTAELSGGIVVRERTPIKLRIFANQFFSNKGVDPDRGVADIFFNWDLGLYTPFDLGFSCSRSCAPRINLGPAELLRDCNETTDSDGKGLVDNATCTSPNSNRLFVNGSGNDANDCLSFQKSCQTIAGAFGKGYNNEIIVARGTYEAPVITVNTTNRGLSLIGRDDQGINETDLYINTNNTLIDLTDQPSTYVFLIRFRFVLNTTRSDSYLIAVDVTGRGPNGQRDFHNQVDVFDLIVTQQQSQSFAGLGFIKFLGGQVTLRNVEFTGLTNAGLESLIYFESSVPRERTPYRFTADRVNFTDIKLTGGIPLYHDNDNDFTHMDVLFTNIRVDSITGTGGSTVEYGLFNFLSNTTFKAVDVINSNFTHLNLGSAYIAPIYFSGTFGMNRAFMNSTFAHNTALRSGGIADDDDVTKLRIVFCGFYDNHFTQSGGGNDLDLGPLSDTYTQIDIIASCGNSGQPKISSTNNTVRELITYCEEPVPPGEVVETRDVVKKKVSAGAVVAIVILVLLVLAAATVGIIIFLWYRKKKQQGYEFIGPGQKDKSVNNADFDVEGRK